MHTSKLGIDGPHILDVGPPTPEDLDLITEVHAGGAE
jgi:hypothetical protein